MNRMTISSTTLGRLLVLGGALVVVGSLSSWVVFATAPAFDWAYPSGIDLGFGIPTVLAGLVVLVVGARVGSADPGTPALQLAFALSLFALADVIVAVMVQAGHHGLDGLTFERIREGVILVAVGAIFAMLAASLLTARRSAGDTAPDVPPRPAWQSLALLVGGLVLAFEGFVFVTAILYYAVTGGGSNDIAVFGVSLETWRQGMTVNGRNIGWDVAYVVFLPLGIVSMLAPIGLLRGQDRAAVIAAALWFGLSFILALSERRLSGFIGTQLVLLTVFVAATWRREPTSVDR